MLYITANEIVPIYNDRRYKDGKHAAESFPDFAAYNNSCCSELKLGTQEDTFL
jgi:hypothetical protein